MPSRFGDCGALDANGHHCYAPRSDHPMALPSGPPLRTDYERALERIREMKADVALALVAIEMLEEELERVRYERDLLREALDNQ